MRGGTIPLAGPALTVASTCVASMAERMTEAPPLASPTPMTKHVPWQRKSRPTGSGSGNSRSLPVGTGKSSWFGSRRGPMNRKSFWGNISQSRNRVEP